MAATCSIFDQTIINSDSLSFLSTMSTDGQTIFMIWGNFVSNSTTKISSQKSVNGGQTFSDAGPVVELADGAGAPLNWNQITGRFIPYVLVSNSSGSVQTLIFKYNSSSVAVQENLYARTTTNGGSSWGTIVELASNIDDIYLNRAYAHMATSGPNDGSIVDVIWSQSTDNGSTYQTYIARSIDTGVSFAVDLVNPGSGVNSFYSSITGSTDGSIGYATMNYNSTSNVIILKRTGNAAYSNTPIYTTTEVNSNSPKISCSADGMTVAMGYLGEAPIPDASLWSVISDNAGSGWTKVPWSGSISENSVAFLVLINSNLVVADGGFNICVSGNSLVSGNSNIVYIAWTARSTNPLVLPYRIFVGRRFLTSSNYTPAVVVATTSGATSNQAGRYLEIVSSYNGAVASIVWADQVEDGSNNVTDAPVAWIQTTNGGTNWSSRQNLTSTLDPDRSLVRHPLQGSYLGNVTNVMFPFNTGSSAEFNVRSWTKRCTTSSNSLSVVRDFLPDQNTWNTNGQHVRYTLTLPAFANGDFKLNQFLDGNVMQSAIPSGPAKTGSVTLSSVTFPTGLYLGSATGGVGNELGANLRYATSTPGTFLVWSTTAFPSTIVLDLIFTTTPLPGTGSQDFFAGSPPWNNGVQWQTQANPFVTYIGSTPSYSSSTQHLLISDAICVAEGSRVKLYNNGEDLPIEEIIPGDLVAGENGQSVPILKLIKLDMPLNCFYRLKNDTSQLLICRNHPVLMDGLEVMPQDIGEEVILPRSKHIYTLITPYRGYVKIEGFSVATWSQQCWDNFIKNDPSGSNLKWKEIV